MHLATLNVKLNLEPEVPSVDRERVLRSIRDRLKRQFTGRIAIRTDGENEIFISFFDENYSRIQSRTEEILETIDSAGQARITAESMQVFHWHENTFKESGSMADEINESYEEDIYQDPDASALQAPENQSKPFNPGRKNFRIPTRKFSKKSTKF